MFKLFYSVLIDLRLVSRYGDMPRIVCGYVVFLAKISTLPAPAMVVVYTTWQPPQRYVTPSTPCARSHWTPANTISIDL